MKDTDYAYAVALIRSHEEQLLTEADLEQMITAPTIKAAEKRLADKGWEITEGKSVREMLNKRLCDAYELVKDAAPDKDALRLLTVRNDFNNLKAALKSLAADTDPTDCYIYPTTLDLDELKDMLAHKRYDELPEAAKRYVEFIEAQTGVPVSMISVGPEREQCIIRRQMF